MGRKATESTTSLTQNLYTYSVCMCVCMRAHMYICVRKWHEEVITYVFFTDFDDTLGNLGQGMLSCIMEREREREGNNQHTPFSWTSQLNTLYDTHLHCRWYSCEGSTQHHEWTHELTGSLQTSLSVVWIIILSTVVKSWVVGGGGGGKGESDREFTSLILPRSIGWKIYSL